MTQIYYSFDHLITDYLQTHRRSVWGIATEIASAPGTSSASSVMHERTKSTVAPVVSE